MNSAVEPPTPCKHERTETHMVSKTSGSVSCADCGQPLFMIVPKWVTETMDRVIRQMDNERLLEGAGNEQ